MGPELGTSVLKTGSSFSQKHLCCPAKVAWLRRWAAVCWALMESKMQSLQSYSWEWDGLYLLSLDPTQHASPVPARISCVGSRGAPRSHAEESFLDVAVGVQKTKQKLIELFRVLWSCVLHCLLSSLSHIFIKFWQCFRNEGIKYLLLRLSATVNSIMVLSLVVLLMFLWGWEHTQGQREPEKGKGWCLSPQHTRASSWGNAGLLVVLSPRHWGVGNERLKQIDTVEIYQALS